MKNNLINEEEKNTLIELMNKKSVEEISFKNYLEYKKFTSMNNAHKKEIKGNAKVFGVFCPAFLGLISSVLSVLLKFPIIAAPCFIFSFCYIGIAFWSFIIYEYLKGKNSANEESGFQVTEEDKKNKQIYKLIKQLNKDKSFTRLDGLMAKFEKSDRFLKEQEEFVRETEIADLQVELAKAEEDSIKAEQKKKELKQKLEEHKYENTKEWNKNYF